MHHHRLLSIIIFAIGIFKKLTSLRKLFLFYRAIIFLLLHSIRGLDFSTESIADKSIFHMKWRFADHLTCYFSSCDPMKYLEHFTTVKAAIKWSCFYLLIYCIIIIIIFSLASHPGSSGILTHTRSIPSGNILPSRACTRERFLLNQPSVSIWMTIQHKPIRESQGSNNCLQKYLCMFWGF